MQPIDLKGVRQASENLQGVSILTPLVINERLSNDLNCKIYLKREDLQQVRSFKIRGAFNKIRSINSDYLKDKILVSKIENLYGLNNASEISKNSDLIMIDRGDLLAEVGEVNLYKAICEISTQAHHFKKPLIMATENLESMQKRLQPSKSEIIALEHSINLGSDIIMLSDETATSPLFMNTLEWLYNFLKQ